VNGPLVPLEEESLAERDHLRARVEQIYAEDMESLGYKASLGYAAGS
jgi:hypothetical protein